MSMENIIKENILKYSYYDESGKLIVVLDYNKVKSLFKADKVTFNEKEV